MKEYEEKTAPILTEFKKTKGLVVDFEAKKGVKDYPRLFELIKDRLKWNIFIFINIKFILILNFSIKTVKWISIDNINKFFF